MRWSGSWKRDHSSILDDAGPDREKKLNEHRNNAREKLATQVKEILNPEQLKRLRQLTLQQEGSFALGQDDVRKELKITQEQMKKFMAVVQELQRAASRRWSRRRIGR